MSMVLIIVAAFLVICITVILAVVIIGLGNSKKRQSMELQFEPQYSESIFCKMCGQNLPADSSFCSKCGAEISV